MKKKDRNKKCPCLRPAALCLCLVLLLSPLSGVCAMGSFTDVQSGDWFARAVYWAVDEQITNGTSATTFSPYEICSRAHIITFLWRAAGQPQPSIFSPFYDVPGGAYYEKAAIWAFEEGLVEGSMFSPNQMCTRGDVVTYLWKLAGKPYMDPAAFVDVSPDSLLTQPVAWAVYHEVTRGTGPDTFSPYDICTRGQIVTFLHRAFEETSAMGQSGPEYVEDPPPAVSGDLTEENVTRLLNGVRDEYPEGAFWSIDSSYTSQVLQLTWAGCAGFALYCSDLVFGDLPISEIHSDFDRIRPGDMVRDEGGRHTVIVLEKYADSILVVEGNYNDTVHWDRVMERTSSEFWNFTVTTRYP